MPELIELPCESPKCQVSITSYQAICSRCHKVWCKDHKDDHVHECAQAKKIADDEVQSEKLGQIAKKANARELTKLLDQVKFHEKIFIKEAETFRPGHTCLMDIPPDYETLQRSKWFAAWNLHFLLTFEDGVRWLLRVRQNRGHRLPSSITTPVIQSEVATLNVLKNFGVAVPAAYLPHHVKYGKENDNVTGLDYFFYEFMEGKPHPYPKAGWLGEIDLPEDQFNQFIEEYAKVQIQLSNLKMPYKGIGCIYPSPQNNGRTEVGPIVRQGCFMNPTPPHFMGPFSTLQKMFLAKIDAGLRYIKINALQGRNPLDEYLWHLEMRELVAASKVLAEKPAELFIKHVDKKGDELMVNDEGKVVGIIDWEWAYVTTKDDAFSTPKIFNFTYPYVHGSNELVHAEKMLIGCYERHDRPDLADCVRNGRLYLRLERIGYYDPAFKKRGFREVFGEDIPKDFDPPEDDLSWRIYMMKRYEHDEGLKEVINRFGWTLEKAEKLVEEAKQV
ncbi:uncharacterized protein L201_003069 [Kwoniella dendrophila CBS 6074]|uniref:AN1-type domain-containing protein n=1 Tax=Kwoniella dendrophila CBS 6074 TaxID=1295534 RepID=A0AAX4JTL5_9TREE